ncbi:MAG: hypothetical protein ACYC1U_06840 [Candidatus Aquicultorales bacterium]
MAKKITEELPAEKKITEELPEKEELSEDPQEGAEKASESTEEPSDESTAEGSSAPKTAPEDDDGASSEEDSIDVDALEPKDLRELGKSLGLRANGVTTDKLRENVRRAIAAGGLEDLNKDVVVLFNPPEDKADFPGMIAGTYIYAGERRTVKLSDFKAVADNPSYKRVD